MAERAAFDIKFENKTEKASHVWFLGVHMEHVSTGKDFAKPIQTVG